MDILTYFKKIGIEGTTSVTKRVQGHHFSVECVMYGSMVYAPFPKFYPFRDMTDVKFYTMITTEIDGVWNVPIVMNNTGAKEKGVGIDVFANNNTHILALPEVKEFVGAFSSTHVNAYQVHENMFAPVVSVDKFVDCTKAQARLFDDVRSKVQLYCISPDDMKHLNTTFHAIADSVGNDAITYVAYDESYADSAFVRGMGELFDVEDAHGPIRSVRLKDGLTLEMTDKKREIFEAAKEGFLEWTPTEEVYAK